MRYLSKIVFINSADKSLKYSEVDLDGNVHFIGTQGVGKSTLIAKLGGEWFSDSLSLSDTKDKTAAEKLQGYWILEIGELAGLKKAEACLGGIAIGEVDPQTMTSRCCPNLHITGEILDVAGLLGGYNLHWAWASGVAAGRAVAGVGPKTASPRQEQS